MTIASQIRIRFRITNIYRQTRVERWSRYIHYVGLPRRVRMIITVCKKVGQNDFPVEENERIKFSTVLTSSLRLSIPTMTTCITPKRLGFDCASLPSTQWVPHFHGNYRLTNTRSALF